VIVGLLGARGLRVIQVRRVLRGTLVRLGLQVRLGLLEKLV
jgi:hypothetical protein